MQLGKRPGSFIRVAVILHLFIIVIRIVREKNIHCQIRFSREYITCRDMKRGNVNRMVCIGFKTTNSKVDISIRLALVALVFCVLVILIHFDFDFEKKWTL